MPRILPGHAKSELRVLSHCGHRSAPRLRRGYGGGDFTASRIATLTRSKRHGSSQHLNACSGRSHHRSVCIVGKPGSDHLSVYVGMSRIEIPLRREGLTGPFTRPRARKLSCTREAIRVRSLTGSMSQADRIRRFWRFFWLSRSTRTGATGASTIAAQAGLTVAPMLLQLRKSGSHCRPGLFLATEHSADPHFS